MAHKSVVVLRGQMARENEFYPCDNERYDQEIDDWDKHKCDSWNINLCAVCNQRGKGKCPLSKIWFCSREHQKSYFIMKKGQGENTSLVYAESELVVEEEPAEEKRSDDDEKKIATKMNQDALFADTDDVDDEGGDDGLLEQKDLNEMTGIDAMGGTSDPITMEFYTRIGRASGDVRGQCLRYCRWPDHHEVDDDNEVEQNGPLWISSTHIPNVDKDIPPCQYCGAPRKFEFQLMPQIIHVLTQKRISDEPKSESNNDENENVSENEQVLLAASDLIEKAKEEGREANLPADFETKQKDLVEKFKKQVLNSDGTKDDNIDFGIIAVYTCTKSCGNGRVDDKDSVLGAYRKEFAWRQPPLQ